MKCDHGLYSNMKLFPEEIVSLKPIYEPNTQEEKSSKLAKLGVKKALKIDRYEAEISLTNKNK